MEVSDLGQNEISTKVSHLHQHISKSRGLGEKQKNESQNSLVRPYFPYLVWSYIGPNGVCMLPLGVGLS